MARRNVIRLSVSDLRIRPGRVARRPRGGSPGRRSRRRRRHAERRRWRRARTARTGVDGTFFFDGTATGSYTLQVDSPGFQPAAQEVTVEPGVRPLDVVLQIAGVVETVVVAAPRLEEELPQEIERTGVRVQTITSAQIENGGYYDVAQALQSLVPGLFLTPQGGAVRLRHRVAAGFAHQRDSLARRRRPHQQSPVQRHDAARHDAGPHGGADRDPRRRPGPLLRHAGGRRRDQRRDEGVHRGRRTDACRRPRHQRRQARQRLRADTSGSGNRFVLLRVERRCRRLRAVPGRASSQPSTTDRERSYDVLNVGGKYAYDFSDAARLSAMYQRSDVKLDSLRPARSSATQAGGLALAFNERDEHIFSAKLDYTARHDRGVLLQGLLPPLGFGLDRGAERDRAPARCSVISDQEFWGYKDYGANLLAKLTPNRGFEYFAGYDFQNYSGEDDVLLIAPNTETRERAVRADAHDPRSDSTRRRSRSAPATTPPPTPRAPSGTSRGQYDFTGNLFARATVGTSFRYPDAYELFADGSDLLLRQSEPEAGDEHQRQRLRRAGASAGATTVDLEAIGFYRKVTDLIVDVDDGSGETTITANQDDKVRVRGVSLVGSARSTRRVSGIARLHLHAIRSGRTSWPAATQALPASRPTRCRRRSTSIRRRFRSARR